MVYSYCCCCHRSVQRTNNEYARQQQQQQQKYTSQNVGQNKRNDLSHVERFVPCQKQNMKKSNKKATHTPHTHMHTSTRTRTTLTLRWLLRRRLRMRQIIGRGSGSKQQWEAAAAVLLRHNTLYECGMGHVQTFLFKEVSSTRGNCSYTILHSEV